MLQLGLLLVALLRLFGNQFGDILCRVVGRGHALENKNRSRDSHNEGMGAAKQTMRVLRLKCRSSLLWARSSYMNRTMHSEREARRATW